MPGVEGQHYASVFVSESTSFPKWQCVAFNFTRQAIGHVTCRRYEVVKLYNGQTVNLIVDVREAAWMNFDPSHG